MPDYDPTVPVLAGPLGVSRRTVNELLRERCALSPEMAPGPAKLLGTTAGFWLNLQRAIDLWDAEETIKAEVRRIEPLRVA